ncbi:hypothetical protein ASG31_06290 [Chryseobacterium sp. Leaf404]|uniref:DUF4377 domain-containing protein n=1 Tax=unclassified Chryseobacterium TaxID=2593645 RepID=UPI0006FEEBA8|nr:MULTISPECIES: DUF4377 domain-containing protein [unclassified Chryseobacterium]KQT18333.1 hypothetical protein ASG31_06290 [Chryseobacterium sp. Leaf404]
MKTLSIIKRSCLTIFSLILLNCTASPSTENSSEKTLFVGSETKDCTGVAPMKCLQVRENATDSWANFYSNIEGFTYEPGFEYELKVRTEKISNPPMDGSSIKYILVKQVSKIKK